MSHNNNPQAAQQFAWLTRVALSAMAAAFCAVAPMAMAAGDSPAAATAADSAAAQSPAATISPEQRQRIQQLAGREGYRLYERDGERLYCKDEALTGTRARRVRNCVTEDRLQLQLDLEHANSRAILDKGLQGFTPRTP
jgi:hypothetical protein